MHLQYFAITIASLGFQVVSCHFSKVILIHGIQFIREHSDCCPGFILIHPDSASQISSIFLLLPLGLDRLYLCHYVAEGRQYLSTLALPMSTRAKVSRLEKTVGKWDFVIWCCFILLWILGFLVRPKHFGCYLILDACLILPACLSLEEL